MIAVTNSMQIVKAQPAVSEALQCQSREDMSGSQAYAYRTHLPLLVALADLLSLLWRSECHCSMTVTSTLGMIVNRTAI